ncbi:MAG: FHA domain-containing protein [Anaerolineales bacterium]
MRGERGSAERESPVLIALSGKVNGTRFPLDREEFLIGRGQDCALVIADRQVSRHHVRLRKVEEGYVVEDLGSKNGTHVNGARVAGPLVLQDGDVIQVALAAKLTYVASEATLPLSLGEASEIGLGRVRMDPGAHRVWVTEKELDPPLSPPQYRLLELLYQNPSRVVSREEIVGYVWAGAEGEGVSEQAIDALARRLRERLADLDPGWDYLVTVRGHGFRLHNPVA